MQLAHFSDVHALELEGLRPWELLSKRFAGMINLALNRRGKHPVAIFEALVDDLNRRPVDHVVVTGDLTNLSLEREFLLARGLLDRLRLGPGNVTVVPGNHDVYTWDARARRLFVRAMQPYVESDRGGEEPFPVVRVRGELAVIGASTALPSPVPFADGWLGRRQLEAIARALDEQRGHFRVLALHHPPYDNRHAILRALRDRRALQEVLARVGCELVVHGHEHRDLRQELHGPNGPIPVIGVGSGTYRSDKPDRSARYNVYHLDGRRLERVETRVYDPAAGAFS